MDFARPSKISIVVVMRITVLIRSNFAFKDRKIKNQKAYPISDIIGQYFTILHNQRNQKMIGIGLLFFK